MGTSRHTNTQRSASHVGVPQKSTSPWHGGAVQQSSSAPGAVPPSQVGCWHAQCSMLTLEMKFTESLRSEKTTRIIQCNSHRSSTLHQQVYFFPRVEFFISAQPNDGDKTNPIATAPGKGSCPNQPSSMTFWWWERRRPPSIRLSLRSTKGLRQNAPLVTAGKLEGNKRDL